MDYHLFHAARAASFLRLRGKRVLVVGCNTGGDCRPFAEAGAFVHGIDVIAEIGADFRHERVAYFQGSAEHMPFADESYDLVYSLATMEHVHAIEAAFREMARVTARGGFVYCVASPLWNSRAGHHKEHLFGRFPWAHLRFTPEELHARCLEAGIENAEGAPISAHIEYIFHPDYFNRRAARDYVRAAQALDGMSIIENKLDLERDETPTQILTELNLRGYPREELLAVSHSYIARKGSTVWTLAERRARATAWRILRAVGAR